MTITDDERREVAAKMRGNADDMPFCGEPIADAAGADYVDDEACWKRLADLIEPAPTSSDRGLTCLREKMLNMADEMESDADGGTYFTLFARPIVRSYASRIREACEGGSDAPLEGDGERVGTDAHEDDEEASMGRYVHTIDDGDYAALCWVHEHGGIEEVRRLHDNGEIWLRELCDELGVDRVDTAWTDALLELRKRLMPEGMEWPKVDGKPVVIGERMRSCGIDDCKVVGIDPANSRLILASDNIEEGKATYFTDFAEDCHRPMPKVLDADGMEIRVGDTLYSVETGGSATVDSIEPGNPWFATTDGTLQHCAKFTHRAPVLAADGKPLREGEHVYHVETGGELVVKELPKPGEHQAVKLRLDDGEVTGLYPYRLTHQRPVLDADGVPIKVGDTVYGTVEGGPFTVTEVSEKGSVFVDAFPDIGMHGSMLTHAKPERDSWERLEEDAKLAPGDYIEKHGRKTDLYAYEEMPIDLVRRAKKLAGVDND